MNGNGELAGVRITSVRNGSALFAEVGCNFSVEAEGFTAGGRASRRPLRNFDSVRLLIRYMSEIDVTCHHNDCEMRWFEFSQ